MRPIDADALQKQLSRKKAEVCNARHTEGFNDALLRFKSMIHAAPTVQPQRIRGRWMEFDYPWFKCSQCGAVREKGSFLENYCPNCGADMMDRQDDQML